MQLASQYTASITYFNKAQKDLRSIYSDCDYERDCFKDKALKHIGDLCYNYESYNFVSEKECNQAGQNVMDLVLGDKKLAVPVKNTAQDKHNDRMLELEKERLEIEKEKLEEEKRQATLAEQARQAELARQQEQARQAEHRRQAEKIEQARQKAAQRRQEEERRQEEQRRKKNICKGIFIHCRLNCDDGTNVVNVLKVRKCVNSCLNKYGICIL